MYTGLVIEELFALVERAEEQVRDQRCVDLSPADDCGMPPFPGFEFAHERLMLAGVA